MVAIAIGIYFIVGLDAGSTSQAPSRKLAEAGAVLTIFGEDASAEVSSPLIVEYGQILQVALNFDFDLSKMRALYIRLDRGGAAHILEVSTPSGIRPGWTAGVPVENSVDNLTLRYERAGLRLVVPGAFAYGIQSGSFVMRILASSQVFSHEEVTALHHRDWVSDPELLAAWTPEIAVFSGESGEDDPDPAVDGFESDEMPTEPED
ncbi:MAG: hypothetical protein ACI9OJ_004188 [Myxococcota bacterium]